MNSKCISLETVLLALMVPATALAQAAPTPAAPTAAEAPAAEAPAAEAPAAAPAEAEPAAAPAAAEPPTANASETAAPTDSVPEEESEEDDAYLYEQGGIAEIGLAPGIKVGGSFSGVFTELGTSPAVELELGYLLPFLDRSFEVFLAGQYVQPTTEGTNVEDASGPGGESRLPGPMSYELTQQQVVLTLGPLYRIPLPIPLFRPYVALGARVYLMKTTITGEADDQQFGENQETATALGFYGALGGELHVGPGAILLEGQFGYAKVDGFVMRDTNAGAINAALGYRFFL